MKGRSNIIDYLNTGARYTMLFTLLYLLVSVFEGPCSHPALGSSFLLITAPFNPLENCILASSSEGFFVAVASNFVFVAILIFGAGAYFEYLSRITKRGVLMSYVFASAVISTYIASAMSFLYFSKFPELKLKVATGTSIIGFDMCMFMAIFMGIEVFYYLKARSGSRHKRLKRLGFDPIYVNTRLGFILIFLILLYSYLDVSLVHLAGLIAIPILAVLVLSFSRMSLGKAISSIGRSGLNRFGKAYK
ncbi:hypothetical protein M1567_02220 [Candidatus Marsarchaeota archaeon]|nr:hypothetical protein [Candidatus Marsarchaeota archaeon]